MKEFITDPHPSTGLPPPLAGYPPELPPELQRQLLEDADFPLCDLAKLAPTCKLFEETYLRQCAAEEQWLAGAANSVFGSDLVGTVARFLTRPRKMTWAAYNSRPRSFNATLGGPLPSDADLFSKPIASLLAPAWGLLAPGKKSAVTWNFTNPAPGFATFRVQMEAAGGCGPVDIVCDNGVLRCSICVQNPGHAAPFLGLLHAVCKSVTAEGPGAGALGDERRPPAASLVVGRAGPAGGAAGKVAWNDVGEIPRDAQRALSALHMWNRRFGGSLPQLELRWGGPAETDAASVPEVAPVYLK